MSLPDPSIHCLGDVFSRLAASQPIAVALLDVHGAAADYGTLVTRMADLGAALRDADIQANTRVAVIAPQGPELAMAVLGTMTWASCAPLNPALTNTELAEHCRDLAVRALVVTAGTEERIHALAGELDLPVITCPVVGSGSSMLALAERSGDDIALVLHTSGTTARPKQVPLSHANLLASMQHIADTLALTTHDRGLAVMPLFHIHGLVASLLAPLGAGGSVICTPGLAVPDCFTWLKALGPSWYSAVPTMHQAILQGAAATTFQSFTGLRFIRSSSSALAPSVLAQLEQVFGCPVVESYGMTEAAHQMASNPLPPGMRKPGSVGRAAGPEICILDAAGNALPTNARGEVAIRGANVFTAYHDRPEANREAFFGGWFRTGDEGYSDDDGYLFLTGRLKEMINRGGEKIAPREIDEALLSHPAVAQAAAFAVPHATLGEDLAAVVTLRPGQQVNGAALREYLFGRLADFKVPSEILITDEIPKGPSGKVQRLTLSSALDSMRTAPPVSPRPGFETTIAEIWAELLGIPCPGRHDNFFRLGGDSLLAMRVVSRLQEKTGADLLPAEIFRHPTPAELADRIEGAGTAPTVTHIPARPGRGTTS
jgi:acyl-CoA synthetase (AMP-forming)/AMP-acid ligase II